MGMSASQARLLQLTARMTDVANRGQNLQNVKIQLAAAQDTLAADYSNELDQLATWLQDAKAANTDQEWTQLNGATLLAAGATIIFAGRTVTIPGEEPEPAGAEPQKTDFTAEADFKAKYPTEDVYVESVIGTRADALQRGRDSVSYSTYDSKISEYYEDDADGNKVKKYRYDGQNMASESAAKSAAERDWKAAQEQAAQAEGADWDANASELREEYANELKAAQDKDARDYEATHAAWKEKDVAHAAWVQNKADYDIIKGMSAEQIATQMSENSENFQVYLDRNGNNEIEENEYVSDYSSTDLLNAGYEAKEAKATAEYEAEMKKLSNKEKKIDMEIKQLDTEYNALKTEHDSLKAVIKDNTEKTFGIFNG